LTWLKAQHPWADLPKRNRILDVEDVGKIRSINATISAPAVDFQTQKLENIPGSNGIPKCKNL